MQPAESDRFVALLGTKGGPAIYPGGPLPTASLLRFGGETIIVDCGAGVATGIARQGIDLKSITMVFVTHLHSDHCLDFGPLMHTAWASGLSHPVDVFGPAGLADYWRHFLAAMEYDIALRRADEGRPSLADLVRLSVIDARQTIRHRGVTVKALRNLHPPIEESYALRFEADGLAVVFSGDTAYFPPLAEFARGADLLIHEAMEPGGIERLVARVGNADGRLRRHLYASHTPVEDVGRIAKAAGVGALALNHLVPSADPLVTPETWTEGARRYWKGPLHVGYDGLRIPLGQ
ncbi:MAG: MBL fold metallo-hydrolase [Alphaproteobacteria bacterium]|nr:MBL fold metallo-hydrolase [Alphaproteobacteria bacterium]